MAVKPTLFLIDGHAMVYRAHYALINRPLMNSKGLNVSAINGFVRSVWEIIKNRKPTHIGVVFDPSGPTFRTEKYIEYKAQRDAQPEDISIAIPIIIDIMKAMNIPVEVIDNFEADDVIGTLSKKAEKEGFTVYMVSPDKDFAQLVSENIYQYKPARFGNDIEIVGIPEVLRKWNIKRIDQVIDMLGLVGDSVDNIPGLPGIGPKTAEKLLAEFDSVEGVIANADKIKGKVGETVASLSSQAILSKELATIHLEAPVEFVAEHYEVGPANKELLAPIFKELEFRSLATAIMGEESVQIATPQIAKGGGQQSSLFGESTPSPTYTAAPSAAVAEFDISNTPHEYIIVDTEDKWQVLLTALDETNMFCFDTETTSLDQLSAELVGISLSIEPHKAWYIPVAVDEHLTKAITSRLIKYFDDPSKAKIGQNLKYDIAMLRNYNIPVRGKLWDTMIMHYLMEPDLRHGMDYMAETYLKYKPVSIKQLIGEKKATQITMREVPLEQVGEYAAEDADITLQLFKYLLPKLEEINGGDLYDKLESQLIYVLEDMERNGVRIDPNYLTEYSVVLGNRIDALELKIHREVETQFNISSPKQVGEILFDKLKIPYRWSRTKQGQYSTDEVKLSELALKYPIVQEILEHRSLSKLRSTYVDALPKLINPVTTRIHSSFNQALASTGRLSSNNPNLQNIPIKTEEGREIRKAFIPDDSNHLLLAADYSQIELRLVAEISGDIALLEAFGKGLDIHTATAARVYNVSLEEVTADQRRNAKTVNFSILYGAGSQNLSRQLGINRTEAGELIEQYFKQFSGLKSYMDRMVNEAREIGYVSTLMGRRRYLRDINSNNSLARSGSERVAVNSPIQGTAADMIKLAMIGIYNKLRENKLKSRLILQVHDELVFDVPKEELEIVKPIIISEMKAAIPNLSVPIEVSVGVGANWLEAH